MQYWNRVYCFPSKYDWSNQYQRRYLLHFSGTHIVASDPSIANASMVSVMSNAATVVVRSLKSVVKLFFLEGKLISVSHRWTSAHHDHFYHSFIASLSYIDTHVWSWRNSRILILYKLSRTYSLGTSLAGSRSWSHLVRTPWMSSLW